MKVFSLVGTDYEGFTLLGVFGSLEDMKVYVAMKSMQCGSIYTRRLGYDQLGYVESELGQEIDQSGMIEYFD